MHTSQLENVASNIAVTMERADIIGLRIEHQGVQLIITDTVQGARYRVTVDDADGPLSQFTIRSLDRLAVGCIIGEDEADQVTDDDMESIARIMGDAYSDIGFSSDLRHAIAQVLGADKIKA